MCLSKDSQTPATKKPTLRYMYYVYRLFVNTIVYIHFVRQINLKLLQLFVRIFKIISTTTFASFIDIQEVKMLC